MRIKYLASAMAAICLLSSTPGHTIGIISNQDPQIAMAGLGGYIIHKSINDEKLLNQIVKFEISRIEDEARRLDIKVNELLQQAARAEAETPNYIDRNIYEGRFIRASDYNTYAGDPDKMQSNQFRLQPDGAAALKEAIIKESANRKGNVALIVHRVAGTMDNSIRMAPSISLEGTPEEVTDKLVQLAARQSPTHTPESIVKITLRFNVPIPPNPEVATQLRNEAKKIQERIPEAKAKTQAQVEQVRQSYSHRFKSIAFLRKSGFTMIGLAIAIGFVRYSFAEGMITLVNACADEDALRTHTVGWALQTGLSEEEVYLQAQEICAASLE